MCLADDELTKAIKKGSEALARYINSGAVEELNDVRPYIDLSDEDKPKPDPDNDNDDSNTVSASARDTLGFRAGQDGLFDFGTRRDKTK